MLPLSTPLVGKSNILIYTGHGTSRRVLEETFASLRDAAPRHTLVSASRSLLATRRWHDDTTMLVLPGGRDQRYVEALQGPPNDSIRDFVAGGGSYLGICAGAYYAANDIQFAMNQPDVRVAGPRPLKFFRGLCRGPMTPKFDYDDFRGSQAWPVHPQAGMAYYHGGGTFVDAAAQSDVEVIHTYDAAGRAPATVACRHGNGLAVLTGLHWEFSGERLCGGYPALMLAALVGSEATRRTEFSRIVQRGLRGARAAATAEPLPDNPSIGDGVEQSGGSGAGGLGNGSHVVEIQ